jgi:hypothetical protein
MPEHDLLVESGRSEVMLSLRHDQPVPAGFEDLADVAPSRTPKVEARGRWSAWLSQ